MRFHIDYRTVIFEFQFVLLILLPIHKLPLINILLYAHFPSYDVIMSLTVVVVTLGPFRLSLMSRLKTDKFCVNLQKLMRNNNIPGKY